MTELNNSDGPSPLENLRKNFNNPKYSRMGTGYKPYTASGNGMDAMKKWLGPKGFKAFQQALCQSITTQIQQDEKKAKTAADKLKASEKGEDPSDITT